ncbi:transposase domain-containing protein [Nostoc sp. CHAB 5834]|nr:transposase domain-containing protein [Nostoc sp. CHAB 5834]
MSLVNFQVQTACFDPKQLLLAVSQVIPSQTITRAIISTSSQEKRHRILNSHVIVALVVAMSFWSSDSIVDVFKNLIHGLSSLKIPFRIRYQVPVSSSISKRSGGIKKTKNHLQNQGIKLGSSQQVRIIRTSSGFRKQRRSPSYLIGVVCK